MRVPLSKHIRSGINPSDYHVTNTPALAECTNIRSCKDGLRPWNLLESPFAAGYITGTLHETPAWPFPQLFIGKSVTLLCFEDTIYSVDLADGTASALTLYDAADMSEASPGTETITGDGPWHFADYANSWMLFNGTSTVFQFTFSDKVWVCDAPTIKTGANWRNGRAVYAGFNPDDFYTLVNWPDIRDFTDEPIPDAIKAILAANEDGATQNSVWFGTIGGGDTAWLHNENWIKYGHPAGTGMSFDDDNTWYDRINKRAQSGILVMPWQGIATRVLNLGEHLAVYGVEDDDGKPGGVTVLMDHSGRVGYRTPTGIPSIGGIASRSAAGGNYLMNFFVDPDGYLWSVDPALKATKLGYKALLDDMLDTDIVISFDERYNELHVTNAVYDVVIMESGAASKSPQLCTNIAGKYAEWFPTSSPVLTTVVTEKLAPVELQGALGTLTRIHIDGVQHATNPWTAAADYKTSLSNDWTRTAFVNFDGRGDALLNAPGVLWRVVLRCATWVDRHIGDAYAEFSDGKTDLSQWINAHPTAAAGD